MGSLPVFGRCASSAPPSPPTRRIALAYEMRIDATGGPEQLHRVDLCLASPSPTQIRLRQTAISLNFVDIYHRTGLYPLPSLPAVLGLAGVGIVEEVGGDVQHVLPGDRIAYLDVSVGAYASERLLEGDRAVQVPPSLGDEMVAGAMLRGITTHMLLTRTHQLLAGESVLIHAGAGGLGQLVTRWAKRVGAVVIATVGSDAKTEIARRAGADHVLDRNGSRLEETVKELSGGAGVHLVVDGIGGSVLEQSLGCVRPFGVVASIGQAAGPIPPLSPFDIGPRRSATLARPSVFAHAGNTDIYRTAADALFTVLQSAPHALEGPVYPLAEAAEAQRHLEQGVTSGSPVLVP